MISILTFRPFKSASMKSSLYALTGMVTDMALGIWFAAVHFFCSVKNKIKQESKCSVSIIFFQLSILSEIPYVQRVL